MGDPAAARRLTHGVLFAALSAAVVFVQILPFRLGPERLPGPALIPLLAFAWVLRRPDTLPTILVAAVMLTTDILLMRPLGLASALVVVGVEILRGRGRLLRDQSFLYEWLLVAGVLLLVALAQSLVLAVFLLDQPALGATGLHLLINVLAYPLVVLVAVGPCGIRRPTRSAGGSLGGGL